MKLARKSEKMIATVKIFGAIATRKGEIDLPMVVQQLEQQGRYTGVHVLINSPGGSVTEGRAIKQYLQSLNVTITTEAMGQCSSIASEIFLAGSRRIIHEGCEMLIHFPRGGYEGTAEQMASYANDLYAVQDEMVKTYLGFAEKKKRGAYNYKQIERMLRKETRLSGQGAYDMGLATELKKSIYAKSNRQNVMAKNAKQNRGLFKAFLSLFKDEKFALDAVLQDGTPIYIDTEEDVAQVGDAVFLVSTGESAPDAEHTLQDGTVIVTVGGLITEIRPAAGATPDASAKVADLEAKIQALQAELEAEKQATAKKDEEMNALQEDYNNMQALARQTLGKKFEHIIKGQDKNTTGDKRVPVVGVNREGLEKFIPKK